ncbi:MAG: ABC transporter permease subunit [Planctomycetales bacterium]|nr:ABC transporter permease subunit [Planctomycetales bacterium]
MLRFLARRLAWTVLTLFLLVTITFFMIRLAPGDPFSGEKDLDPEVRLQLNKKYGLDGPLHSQYLRYLGGLLQGDLGPSSKQKDFTVNEILRSRFPVSLRLGFCAMVLALLLGLTAGIVAALRHNSPFDYASMAGATVGLAVPTFVVGPILVLVFALKLGWFNTVGFDVFPRDYILPSLTLALPFAARIARLARAGMLEVIHQDYVRTARAKGLLERVVVLRHAVRGGLLPVVSYIGPAMADILAGSLVVETIFRVPGLGWEFVTSAGNRDYMLVMGTVIVYGSMLVLFNLLVDLAYHLIDPRVRVA